MKQKIKHDKETQKSSIHGWVRQTCQNFISFSYDNKYICAKYRINKHEGYDRVNVAVQAKESTRKCT